MGGRWGCAVATILVFPLFLILLVGEALGDCVPDVACDKSFLRHVLLPSGVVAAAVFGGVRRIVNRWRGGR